MLESVFSKISSLVITTGVVSVIVWKTWKWMGWSRRSIQTISKDTNSQDDSSQYISTKTVVVIDTAEEWDAAYAQLKEDLMKKKVLGMDCEWVHKKKVALLQLCSANGFCVLVRLFRLEQPYPTTLISLLAEKRILKTGVAVVDDGHKLHRDYGLVVSGCVDLRHIVRRMRLQCYSLSLKGLASKILHIEISKNPAIRCGNWEAEIYSEPQIHYAATDAAVGVDIFVRLVLQKLAMSEKLVSSESSLETCASERSSLVVENINGKDSPGSSFADLHSNHKIAPSTKVDSDSETTKEQELLNTSATVSHENLSKVVQTFQEVEGSSKYKQRETVSEEDAYFWRIVSALCQGLVDVNFVYKTKGGQQSSGSKKTSNKKDGISSYSTRQRPLWDNCRLQAPDGSVLCTCDVKKAQWYIEKDLGDKVSDDPFTVRLRFEPSSRPQSERNYYLQEKENQCVVCGHDKDYVRKFVIPFEYKKFFPSALKDHSSHDVLLLCIRCHQKSCEFDSDLRCQLAEECDAPLESGPTAKTVVDHDLQKVRSAGRALKHNRNSIPESRVRELEQTLLDYFGVDVVSDDLIEQGADIDARQTAEDYVPHGKRVVRHMSRNGGLVAFQARWRQHFLDTMNPQFLPACWSVDYVPEGWNAVQRSS